MAALQCEICGGKLMAKAGGLFECEYCGMQYDKTRIQEMVQEIKGTVKVEGTVEVKGTVKVEGSVSVDNYLKRGFLFLEDGLWNDADTCFNDALAIDAACVQAHLGRLMAQCFVASKSELASCDEAFDGSRHYKNVLRFGDQTLVAELTGYLKQIRDRIEYERKEEIYRYALEKQEEGEFQIAVYQFDLIPDHRDAQARKAASLEQLKAQKKMTAALAETAKHWICVGEYLALGVQANGTVRCDGKIAGETRGWKDIVAVSANEHSAVGLKSDGTVLLANVSSDKIRSEVRRWKGIVEVSLGGIHMVGLKADGTVVTAGYELTEVEEYRLADADRWTNITAVSAGGWHTVGLKEDGTVVAAGCKHERRCDVGAWRDITAISAGENHTVGLKADGTVVAVGSNYFGQCQVGGWKNIVSVCAGERHTVGLMSDGTVVSTQIVNDQDDICKVDRWKNMIAVCACGEHTLGLSADGSLTCVSLTLYRSAFSVYGWRLFKNLNVFEEAKKDAEITKEVLKKQIAEDRLQAEQWRMDNKCQYCGNAFKGLFSKKCSSCGLPKDY